MFRFAQHDNEKHPLIRVIHAIRSAVSLSLLALNVLVHLFVENLEG
jgi:hypothetical protein